MPGTSWLCSGTGARAGVGQRVWVLLRNGCVLGQGCECVWVSVAARCGPRGARGLSCHQSGGFKHLNNFNDDHIIATHISWELINAR